jgi:hypothetical protein
MCRSIVAPGFLATPVLLPLGVTRTRAADRPNVL